MMYRATAVKWACLVLVKWNVLRKESATPDEATPDEASPDVAMIGVHTLPFNQSPCIFMIAISISSPTSMATMFASIYLSR